MYTEIKFWLEWEKNNAKVMHVRALVPVLDIKKKLFLKMPNLGREMIYQTVPQISIIIFSKW